MVRWLLQTLVKAGIPVRFLMILMLLGSGPAVAQSLPSDDDQDILIISTLLTFNDANLTGNYSVLRARASQQFQEQVSLKQLEKEFDVFRKNAVNIAPVAISELVPDDDGAIDKKGVLRLSGYFDLPDLRVIYVLKYVQNGGDWKLLSLDVKVKN